ncbi:MAG: aldo/keto reductase [Novosphingobium sp.]|nr:aldo/keto reductase [Novosphingobium sp.]
MRMRKLGSTGIEIAPLVLGGNVFGWTADKETSFAILDAFLDAGFNAIDTADVYNRYAPGLVGGESETVIGEWMKDRGVRDRVVIITKGGLPMGEGMEGLGSDYLPRACDASLRRLQTDYIDVYLSHRADPTVPVGQSLDTFQSLIDAGKIRHAGCSNYSPDELAEALAAGGTNRSRYEVFQPQYNLVERCGYEGRVEDLCTRYGIGVITYYALAAGFLTGKYRSAGDAEGKARGGVVSKYCNADGFAVLDKLDAVAARHGATPAQVALAWNAARPSVSAPIASATNLSQLSDIMKSALLDLTDEDMATLDG